MWITVCLWELQPPPEHCGPPSLICATYCLPPESRVKALIFARFVRCSVSNSKDVHKCLLRGHSVTICRMSEQVMECPRGLWIASCVWCILLAIVCPVKNLKCVLLMKRATLYGRSSPNYSSSPLLHNPSKLDSTSFISPYRTCQTINIGNHMLVCRL